MIALWSLPLLHLAWVATTPLHHLAYDDARLVQGVPFDALIYSFSPLDQLAYGYLMLLGLGASGLLFKALLGQAEAFRAQLLPVAIAVTLPLIRDMCEAERMSCPSCGQRKGRRDCPALGQPICTVWPRPNDGSQCRLTANIRIRRMPIRKVGSEIPISEIAWNSRLVQCFG